MIPSFAYHCKEAINDDFNEFLGKWGQKQAISCVKISFFTGLVPNPCFRSRFQEMLKHFFAFSLVILVISSTDLPVISAAVSATRRT